MRKATDRQLRLDSQPIGSVSLNVNCRSEIIPILVSLQYLYSKRPLRDEVLQLIAKDVNGKSSGKRGRPGMDYWPILVLAAVRLGCNLRYDDLQDLAEQHRALRQTMGIGDWSAQKFDWRQIQHNITAVRPETLERINHLVVKEGHILVPRAVETLRADSFVMETNIHYPTDSSLIRDGLRKVLCGAAALAERLGVVGWRQHKHLYRKARGLAREIDRVAARKGNGYQARLQPLYRSLLELGGMVLGRVDELRAGLLANGCPDGEALVLDAELQHFVGLTRRVCDVARRRVLEGQSIPNGEKLFSIFETHTQLYKRGKAGEPVQFGRQALVYEDAAGFITHAYLMPRDRDDRDVVVEQTRKVQKRAGGRIRRASFDRGFHSPENQRALAQIVEHPCLPMMGARQGARQKEQAGMEFRQARRSHPGIESAIHAVQDGNGLARCRDRTERGLARYLQLGVLGRNLHVLGKILLARQDAECQAAYSRRQRIAA
jgi:IS5 family transposase